MIEHLAKKIIYIFICLFFIFFINACNHSIVIPGNDDKHEDNETIEENRISIHSSIMIKGNPHIIKDCTPELTIFTEKDDVIAMSFSGNGDDWSSWVDYNNHYNHFNISSGHYGTSMESGLKTIYVRFKDAVDNIFPGELQEAVSCTVIYEIQELFTIKIDPDEVKLETGGSHLFIVKGFDLYLNEVPLDGKKVKWTKPCGTGELNPITGLKTTYTAPELPGVRNITAHYGSLRTGAKIHVLD